MGDFVSASVSGALERIRGHADGLPRAAHCPSHRSSELPGGDGQDRRSRSAERCAEGPRYPRGLDDSVEARDESTPKGHVEHVVERGGEQRTVTGRQSVHKGGA